MNKVDNFHTHILNYATANDARVGGLIAAKLNIQHEVYDGRKLTARPRAVRRRVNRFHAQTGFEVPVLRDITTNLYRHPPREHVLLRGNVMELLRAQHWKGRKNGGEINHQFGIKRCLFTSGPLFKSFISKWDEDYRLWLSQFDYSLQDKYIDIGFIEHNLPNFEKLSLGFDSSFFLSPFNDRSLFRLTVRFPIEYRSTMQASIALISKNRPDLLDIPYEKELMRKIFDDLMLFVSAWGCCIDTVCELNKWAGAFVLHYEQDC